MRRAVSLAICSFCFCVFFFIPSLMFCFIFSFLLLFNYAVLFFIKVHPRRFLLKNQELNLIKEGKRSWSWGLRAFFSGCAVTSSWKQAWSEGRSDGPRGEEGGSEGTEETRTFRTRGDSARDASHLCQPYIESGCEHTAHCHSIFFSISNSCDIPIKSK